MQQSNDTLRKLALFTSALSLTSVAGAQTFEFSVDWRGPTVGLASSGSGDPITEGSILIPEPLTPAFGPLAAPRLYIPEGALGLAPGCAGHPGGTPCHVEVDALSHGRDDRFSTVHVPRASVRFSVDEYASGFPGVPAPPNAMTEGPASDLAGDTLTNLDAFPPVIVGSKGHTQLVDGNGLTSLSGFVRPGVGIIEPRMISFAPAASGDNLDALNIESETLPHFTETYFSLDGGLVDPFNGLAGTGSAAFHGFVGGDVLVAASGALTLYAPAPALGLDIVGGPGSDDLDALILWENGVPGYQPPMHPFEWVAGGKDMLVYSVRRGSAIIGAPDSRFGIPITEGDLLMAPTAGGFSVLPAILIPAESLGLATMRSGISLRNDDLDAADYYLPRFFDCNGNGIEDALELVPGTGSDLDGNGKLDACEGSAPVGSTFCFCGTGAPCGNTYSFGGCANGTGVGAILSGTGSASLALDNLVLETSQMSPTTFALTFRGTAVSVPMTRADGLSCVGGLVFRLPPYATGSGTASIGPGLSALTRAINPSAGWIFAGSTWNFQTWYRSSGTCGGGSNMSNALAVTFAP